MQIALTKKLADALGIQPEPADESINPLFSWTVSWTKTWDGRRGEDLLVLVNDANRLTVALYQVKRKDLRNVERLISKAIQNTLLALHFNPELVEEYLAQGGAVQFRQNKNRQKASWVTKAGMDAAFMVSELYERSAKVFNDLVGLRINYAIHRLNKADQDGYRPYKRMGEGLSALTGQPVYKQRALEFLVTLDVGIYKVKRRIIVPARLDFWRMHLVLQEVFDWEQDHLFDFAILPEKGRKPLVRLLDWGEELEYDDQIQMMAELSLDEFFPEQKRMIYTYDFGDNWEHQIKLVRVIEDCQQELPYLLEASGKTPPEDVGGVPGFLAFYEAFSDPAHPEHKFWTEWGVRWWPELAQWESKPRPIHI